MMRKLGLGAVVALLPLGLVLGIAPGTARASGTPPSVKHIAPHHGPAAGGTAVAIDGTNLNGATVVDFGSKPARFFKVVSRRIIIATSPTGTGVVDITVTTPSGTSTTSKSDEFTYGARMPVVSDLVPRHGRPADGTTVTIIGDDFSGATAVHFGANPATDVTVFSGHLITAKSPAGTGTVDVTVTTPDGTSATTPKHQFSYNTKLPVVTHVDPRRGPPSGGTSVTIGGSNFTRTTAVDSGTNTATDVTVITDHLISATSPAHRTRGRQRVGGSWPSPARTATAPPWWTSVPTRPRASG